MFSKKGHDETTHPQGESQKKAQGKDTQMGSHKKGLTNSNSEHLLDTLRDNNMIITNTKFPPK